MLYNDLEYVHMSVEEDTWCDASLCRFGTRFDRDGTQIRDGQETFICGLRYWKQIGSIPIHQKMIARRCSQLQYNTHARANAISINARQRKFSCGTVLIRIRFLTDIWEKHRMTWWVCRVGGPTFSTGSDECHRSYPGTDFAYYSYACWEVLVVLAETNSMPSWGFASAAWSRQFGTRGPGMTGVFRMCEPCHASERFIAYYSSATYNW